MEPKNSPLNTKTHYKSGRVTVVKKATSCPLLYYYLTFKYAPSPNALSGSSSDQSRIIGR